MKRIFAYSFVFCAALWLSFPAHADNTIKIVVFGDSIVSGVQMQPPQTYAARMEDKMREVGFTDIQVVDMSREGMTTAIGIDKVNAVLEAKPDVVIVAFGADDVERGVAVEQIYNNLINITGRLSQSSAYVILAGMKAPPGLGYSYVKQFENMYQLVSFSRKSLLVPDILAGITDVPQLTMADGVHPNSRGVDYMIENSYRFVDTCVRTKIQGLQYQQDYKAYQENSVQRR